MGHWLKKSQESALYGPWERYTCATLSLRQCHNYLRFPVHVHMKRCKAKQMEALKTVTNFQRKKVSCLEQDSNQRSPAYMAGALPVYITSKTEEYVPRSECGICACTDTVHYSMHLICGCICMNMHSDGHE